MSSEFMRGASASINKTLGEIELLLEGESFTKAGKLRKKLRGKLLETLEAIALDWLEHGFVGGHAVAAQRFAKDGEFPKSISVEVERSFPIRKASKKRVAIRLESTLKKKYAKKLARSE